MNREDFDNNIDWVVYKVTGRKPTNTKTTVELVKHQLPSSERINNLKFYHNGQNGRFGCLYNNTFICACKEEEIRDVQEYFDKKFNGNNLKEVSEALRDKYNLTKRYQTYKNGTLRFSERDGRLTATINDNKKTHTICCCYPNQREEVTEKFNTLRKTRSLESIKKTMKSQYNIQRTPKRVIDGSITLDRNGTIYKDGQFCKADPKIYEFVDAYLQK